jgi:uncharacterized membrane protein YccF (DUF307 family)
MTTLMQGAPGACGGAFGDAPARQLPLLVRFLYLIFCGFWVGGIAAAVGWVLSISVIGLPLGIWILHRLPLVTTLTMPEAVHALGPDGRPGVLPAASEPFPFVVRAIYFVLLGWWGAAIWIKLAFVLTATVILAPAGFWMINRVPAVLTLEGM